MPRNLHLVRHAKSSWDEQGLRDHDRPLAPRGIASARALGRYFESVDLELDLVLCSTARRTIDTWQLLFHQASSRPPMIAEIGLYLCGDEALIQRLRTVDTSHLSVMVIAHNPDLEVLTRRLTTADPNGHLDQIANKFPTGAYAMLSIIGDTWDAVGKTPATLTSFIRPRDLSHSDPGGSPEGRLIP